MQAYSDYTILDVWVYFILGAFFFAHLPDCMYNVIKARRAKNLPIAPIFLEWIPMIVYVGATAAWLGSPYSTLLSENHLTLHCLTQSFVFGRLTTKTILAHLTRQPFPYWTMQMAPLIGGAVLTNLPRVGIPAPGPLWEHIYMWAYFVFAVVAYFRWAALVIEAICSYLGINCLTIPKEKRIENSKLS